MNMVTKKVLVLGGLLATSITLIACSSNETELIEVPVGEASRFEGVDVDTIKIVTDSERGCKYILLKEGIGQSQTIAFAPLQKDSQNVDCGQE